MMESEEADVSAATPRAFAVTLRGCRLAEFETTLDVINRGALSLRHVLGPERMRAPLLCEQGFSQELAHGVAFWGAEVDGRLVAVAGVRDADGCDLIKYAYVLPDYQRRGVGSALLGFLIGLSRRRIIAGVWFEAIGAVRFFMRMGFRPLNEGLGSRELLERHWRAPDGRPEASALMTLPSAHASVAWSHVAQAKDASLRSVPIGRSQGNSA